MRPMMLCLLAVVWGAAGAEDLLRTVEGRLAHTRITRGHFVQEKQLVGISRPLKSSGSFLVDRDRGVIWRSELPFASSLRITRGEIVQFDGNEELMHLSAAKEPTVGAISGVLFATFTGDFAQLGQYFELQGDAGPTNWRVILKPRQAALARVIGELTISGNQTVRHVAMKGSGGDLLQIEFVNVETAQAPTASEQTAFD